MCGIFGSPTLTPSVKAMLPYLGIQMQTRGRDAWGASDGQSIIKRVGPIVDSWATAAEAIQEWDMGIFHTRGASVGTPKQLENAHPFAYPKEDGSTVIGIHNGFISNHDELDKQYQRDFEVDSQHIWAHRAAGLPWSDIRGWGNLAWWECANGAQRMNLLRFNTFGLHVARLKDGEYVFCSEVTPISTIAQMLGNPAEAWIPIDEYCHYWFAEDAETGKIGLWKGDKLEFGKTPAVTGVQVYTPGFHNRGTQQGHRPTWHSEVSPGEFCYKCNSTRVYADDVVCGSCLRGLIDDYLRADEEVWRA